ncbi:MAG: beta-propeller domain-containing protein, partial [Deltaproteobacteria bacterium]|nr:beta-propeller domain-containing protein [Deltaproteobacteria bacterium]
MKHKWLCLVLAGGCVLAAGGCGDEASPVFGVFPARLTRAQSCAQLQQMLQDDLMVRMNATIDAQIAATEPEDSGFGVPVFGGSAEASAAAPAASSSGQAGEPEHSETNVQVEGVDEADIVKTDGNFLYVLHGSLLTILTAWPASDLALASSTPIEGRPLELFLAGDRVVVYSEVEGKPVYEASGLEPPAQAGSEQGYCYGAPMPAAPAGSGAFLYPLTKATVLGLDGTKTTVQAELYFEGSYRSARRVEGKVRTVLTGGQRMGPPLRYCSDYAYGGDSDSGEAREAILALREENAARIAASTLDDYVPRRFVRHGAKVEAAPLDCSSFWVPTAGTTEYGMAQVHAFDLGDLGAGVHDTYVVGEVETVYSSLDALYLAARFWASPLWAFYRTGRPESTTGTHLHKFDLTADPARPTYVASGTVYGEVHNQFSLDERDGRLRVATTDQIVSESSWQRASHVFVLEQRGADLVSAGAVMGLAPGEDIYAVRFVADRGYVVTFRQTDPLFVIDLSNPTQPQLVAELVIPGFSEYMHPLDDGRYLLTVGRDGNGGGLTGSPALQIFDVSDATAPKLVHKHVLPGGYSEAEADHKAFTFWRDVLAIPLSGYGGSWMSELALFGIDPAAGINPLGTIDHSPFFADLGSGGYVCGEYGVGVRRGVFVEDYVYSISAGGVLVNAMKDLAQPLASAALPDLNSP